MRPWELLPLPAPRDYDPAVEEPLFFYKNFVKPMIPDMIKIMDAGLYIDADAVEELRKTIDKVLESVQQRLEANPLIKEFQNTRLPDAQRKHAEKATAALRTLDDYIKEFKETDITHRTWAVNTHLRAIKKPEDRQDKWTMADLKKYNFWLKDPYLEALIHKRDVRNNRRTVEAMRALAKYKLDLWNRPRIEKANTPVDVPDFNPGSDKQKKELFEFLNIEPREYSKDTGEPSWKRKILEDILHEMEDPNIRDILESLIDFSYSAIIRNNFLKAFDSYTIDGVLHGNIKLFGAKSFRPTSNSPNLLNAPSSGSIYAKPLKRCFISPKGYVIYAIDEQALEDRILANLTNDTNKKNVFLEGLDGHSLNACGYFAQEVEKILGPNTDPVEYVKRFYEMSETDDQIKKIRTRSKAPTFKLAYGGYPDDHKGGVITQEIFDNYHNILYPGVTDYRENYVLQTTKRQGYIHLGLGCRIYSKNPEQDIRTLHNATIQFWSILSLLAINEFNFRVDEAGLSQEVRVHATIYDSVYSYVLKEAEILKWVNDNIVECMTVDFMVNQPIPNEAKGEVGQNWADLTPLSNNATLEECIEVLKLT